MHSSLLASQSSVLDALVHSGLKESSDRLVIWEHIAEHTFAQFSEFAYTGDFTIAGPSVNNVGANTSQTVEISYGSWFVQYADLMVFAECYAIDDLLVLANSKLEKVLNSLPMKRTGKQSDQNTRLIEGICDLCQYCYSRKPPQILSDLVRSVLKKYAASLWQDEKFQKVVKESQPIAIDFIGCIVERL